MAELLAKVCKKTTKSHDIRKASSSPKDQHTHCRKQQRKGENPVRVSPNPVTHVATKSHEWICKNSACRATLSMNDTFCKRCSCCICHLFDDNKDPSLWLECTSESGLEDICGLSCHIECAFQHCKVGVVDLGPLMELDGSYCCASCGKVSGILGCWKKQLNIAKDARRVDVLCYRLFLSFRLLDGTSRFSELHEIVKEAKAKLETEVGPVNGVSAKMARGIVSMLSVAVDVQTLCSTAVEKAEKWIASKSIDAVNFTEGSLPAACKFLFEEVTSSSAVVLLIEFSTASNDNIKGYKLWFCKTREETYTKEPVCVFPRDHRRFWISNLQACTEYSFRIVSYSDSGDIGHSEAKCFTKSMEIIHKNSNSVSGGLGKESSHNMGSFCSKLEPRDGTDIELDSGFKVRDLGKILRLAWAQEQGCFGFESFHGANTGKFFSGRAAVKIENLCDERVPPVSRLLDLNVASVPDLNEEFTPPVELCRDEGNGCTLGQPIEADDCAISYDHQRDGPLRVNGRDSSHNRNHGKNGEVPAVDSTLTICQKRRRSTNGEMQDSDSTLTNGSPLQVHNDSGCLDDNFEYCVKIIRWLECEGHLNHDFRLKLLTWFSLRSTEQERRVVHTFIQTLIDDPGCLAGQLVDSFTDILSSKRPPNGFCNEFWH